MPRGQELCDTSERGRVTQSPRAFLLPEFPSCWNLKDLQVPPAQGKVSPGKNHPGTLWTCTESPKPPPVPDPCLELHLCPELSLIKRGIRLCVCVCVKTDLSSSCTQICQNSSCPRFTNNTRLDPATPTLSYPALQRSQDTTKLQCIPGMSLSKPSPASLSCHVLPQPRDSPAQRISCRVLPVSPLTCSGCSGSASAK